MLELLDEIGCGSRTRSSACWVRSFVSLVVISNLRIRTSHVLRCVLLGFWGAFSSRLFWSWCCVCVLLARSKVEVRAFSLTDCRSTDVSSDQSYSTIFPHFFRSSHRDFYEMPLIVTRDTCARKKKTKNPSSSCMRLMLIMID